MRAVCLIQARLGSSRFKNKVLADLNGKTVLQHVYERACQIPGVDYVEIIVPWEDCGEIRRHTDDLWRHVWATHEANEADVLARYQIAARCFEADIIMRLTSDCPALDPVVAGQVLELFHASQPCDFASNDTLISGYPDGWDVEVFSREALERAAAEATDASDREHVTPWMERNLRCVTLYNPESWTGPKLSVDTVEDLEMVKTWLAC